VQAAVIANTLMQTLVEEGRTILGVDRTMRRASIQIIEQAQPNSDPSSGGPMRIVALAVVTSALVTIGIIWVVDYADTSVRSAKHIERAFGIQTLSTIPCASLIDTRTNLVSTTKPFSVVTEAYRLLRVRIAAAAHEQRIESILVASSEHDVGRSTIAANLAVVLAQSGKRVVIVDTDLRRPTIHRLFGLKNQRGVTDILHQATPSSVGEFLQPTHVKDLYALTSGTRTNYPTELLETDTIQGLLDQLKAYADIIVLDSPPLRQAVDAIVVARCIDTTVLVAQVGKTSQEYLEDAISQLHSFNVNLLGVVLNNRPNVLIQLPAFVILKKNIDAKARNQHDLTQKNDVQREPVAHSADMT
jgi:non-specific protein-tyrosine kinase